MQDKGKGMRFKMYNSSYNIKTDARYESFDTKIEHSIRANIPLFNGLNANVSLNSCFEILTEFVIIKVGFFGGD
jgi:hypothetical protein